MTVNRRAWLKLAAVTATTAGGGVLAAEGASAAAQPSAPTATPPAEAVIDHPGSGRDYRPAIEALRRYVDQHLAAYSLPGLSLSLADRDGFSAVLTAGWSDIDRREPVRADHIFQIGSISKSFCALAILKLVDAGKLSLDTEVRDLLPGVALPDGARITVRHLLTHSSGLPADAPLFPRGGDGLLWQGFEPGSQFSYSNTGYGLLGEIASRLYAMPYHQVLTQAVLEPLGLGEILPRILVADRARYAVSYEPYYSDRPYARGERLGAAPWINLTEASGCMAATARQMAGYLRWLIAAGAGPGASLLSESSRRLFTTPSIKAPDFGPDAQYCFGLAVIPIDGRPCLHHTGGMVSFSSAITVDPAAGIGCFASVNARAEDDYRPREVTAYALQLMRAVREGRALSAAAPIAPPEVAKAPDANTAPVPPELARLAGTYDSNSPWTGQVTVIARADGLWLDGATPLVRLLDGSFRIGADPNSPERLRFDGDLGGRPLRLNFSGADFIRL